MADPKKMSALPAAVDILAAEFLVLQDGANKRAPVSLVLQSGQNLSDLNDPVAARAALLIIVIEESDYAALSPPDADALYFIVADT